MSEKPHEDKGKKITEKSTLRFYKDYDLLSIEQLFSPTYHTILSLNITIEYLKKVISKMGKGGSTLSLEMNKIRPITIKDMVEYHQFRTGLNSGKANEKFVEHHIKKFIPEFKQFNLINIGLADYEIDNLAFMTHFKLASIKLISNSSYMLKSLNLFKDASFSRRAIIIHNGVGKGTKTFSSIFGEYIFRLGRILIDDFAPSLSHLCVSLGGYDGDFEVNSILLPNIEWSKFGIEFVHSFDLLRDSISVTKGMVLTISTVLSVLLKIVVVIQCMCEKALEMIKDNKVSQSKNYDRYDPNTIVRDNSKSLEEIIGCATVIISSTEMLIREVPKCNGKYGSKFQSYITEINKVYSGIYNLFDDIGTKFINISPNDISLYKDIVNHPETSLQYIKGYIQLYLKYGNVDVLIDSFIEENRGNITSEKIKKFVEELKIESHHKNLLLKIVSI